MTEVVESVDARTGAPRGLTFPAATVGDVEHAASSAAAAATALAELSPAEVALLLRIIGQEIERLGDELLEVADAETALGLPRMRAERARTVWQLEAFARLVESGDHLEAVIDRRDPEAVPAPRPDIRRVHVPLGPVGVFAASNFPLAFSVAGGDTSSALAAGCPVVVKAHPSHPATSDLVAGAVTRAIARQRLPAGTFGVLHGAGPEVGRALVEADAIEAVGFTGSLRGGRALFDAAVARARPIPFYAEMGSTNPVFVTRTAVAARGDAIAEGLASSFTMGVGQFCTKPGLVFVPGRAADELATAIGKRVADAAPQPMLNDRLLGELQERTRRTAALPGVEVVAGDPSAAGRGATPLLLATDLGSFRAHPELAEEHFGPVLVIVRADDEAELIDVAHRLEGNLTATMHAEEADAEWARRLGTILQVKVGRIVWNGFPTGVAVTDAMVHGGPYPATTAPATTSVGLAAIRRFQRPVAWQEVPDRLLPPALQDANPLGLRRRVDGQVTDVPISS